LGEDEIQALEDMQWRSPYHYKVYALGEFGVLGEIIFNNWQKVRLEPDFVQQFDRSYNGIDFGYNPDPFAFVQCFVDKRGKNIYIYRETGGKMHTNDLLAQKVTPHITPYDYVSCDSAEPKSIEDLCRHGIDARGAYKLGLKKRAIVYLQMWKLYIDESCVNILDEISTYQLKKDRSGNTLPEPQDGNDHYLDAFFYSIWEVIMENREAKAYG
jgi:phage terminase large subunit